MSGSRRGAKGGGSIRKRKDGRWEARFIIGIDPGTGKDIRKSVYATTQKEARKKMTEALAALDQGDYREPSKMSVGTWLDIWTAEYLGGIKPSTVFTYKQQIRRYIKPAMGAVKLRELNPHFVQQFYNSLGEATEGRKALSAKTVKNVHGVLHQALQQAVMIGYIRNNPTDYCNLPRMTKKELLPLNEEQSKAFLKEIQGQRFEVLFTVTLFTGMREGEVLGLMWDCVNFENGTILIDKQLQTDKNASGTYVFTSPKSGKNRTITPAPWVMKLLRRHYLQQTEQRLKVGPLWENSGLVFVNEFGRHLAFRTVYTDFKKAVTAIGRPDARFHDLRHSYAVAAIRSGDDIKTVQENLGHASAAFTLDVYGHVTEQMKLKSADRMEGYIKDVLNL